MTLTQRAPAFPVYGLDGDWAQRRLDWLCGHRYDDEDITYGVWLGHAGPSGGVRVGTFAREWLDQNPLTTAAGLGVESLVDLTMPANFGEPGPGVVDAITHHAKERATQHAAWPRVAWQIDGDTVAAPVWEFAGGWTAYTDALPTVVVVAVGVGVSPENLSLSTLTDGSAYGIDLSAPLDRRIGWNEERDWQETIVARPNEHWHPDQLAAAAEASAT